VENNLHFSVYDRILRMEKYNDSRRTESPRMEDLINWHQKILDYVTE
jgi:hypothetical protein